MFFGNPSHISQLAPAVFPSFLRLAKPLPSFRFPRAAGTPFDPSAHRRSPKPALSGPIHLLIFNSQLPPAASSKHPQRNACTWHSLAQLSTVECALAKKGRGVGVSFLIRITANSAAAPQLFLTMRPVHVYFYFSWEPGLLRRASAGHANL